MGELTQHTLLQLQQGISGEELVRTSRIASDLIVKATHPMYTSGFADTDAEEVTRQEREQLLDALTSQLSRVQTEEDIL